MEGGAAEQVTAVHEVQADNQHYLLFAFKWRLHERVKIVLSAPSAQEMEDHMAIGMVARQTGMQSTQHWDEIIPAEMLSSQPR